MRTVAHTIFRLRHGKTIHAQSDTHGPYCLYPGNLHIVTRALHMRPGAHVFAA